jgi:hypothetical protein
MYGVHVDYPGNWHAASADQLLLLLLQHSQMPQQ